MQVLQQMQEERQQQRLQREGQPGQEGQPGLGQEGQEQQAPRRRAGPRSVLPPDAFRDLHDEAKGGEAQSGRLSGMFRLPAGLQFAVCTHGRRASDCPLHV
jgi:hypothetical protein